MSSSYMRGAGESLESLKNQAGQHTNWRDSLNNLFSNGVNNVDWSTREFDDNGRVKVTKTDILLGRSQPELQAAWEKTRQTQIRDTLGDRYYEAFGSDLTVDHKTDPGKLSTKINKETKRAEDVKPYLTALTTTRGGAEILAGLGDRPTVEEAQQALSGLTTSNVEEAETKDQAETRRLEGRIDSQRASDEAWRRYQSEENSAWRKSQSEKEDKRYDMQMQLAMMDRADKREDRRIAREDRQADKRQASIMMLIKGLTQLGAGFSV